MKKSIILLCAFFATLHVYAQDVPAILFFQNDSIIQSFLRSEVDSLGYSYVDINGETQNEVATQLVYLKDTIIQIPLAEIDSVVYTPPSYSIWVMTRNPKDIGHYKATLCGTLGGKFAPDAVINETGFLISYYSKEGKVNKKVSVGNSIGDFEKEIDFKKPEYGCKNIFYYRAYAIVNGVGYVGTERIISLSPIELTAYSAKVSKEPTTEDECSVTVYGDISLSHRKEIEEAGFPMGFFVGKKDNLKADDDGVMRFDGELNENGLIESKLDGLEPGTKYYYRPFIETCKIEYGGTGSFVTPPQVVVTTKGYSDIDIKATTAKLSLSVDVKMDERQLDSFPVGIQIIGPRYSPDDEEHQQFDFWVRDTPHQEFSGIVKNLIPNSLYTYRAYAEINGKLYYGEGIDFWTKDLEVKTYDAEVSRDEVESATVIAISISGEVFEAEAVKRGEQCGFYYDTYADVDINSSKIEFNFVGDYQSSSPYSWHKNWVEYKDVAFYYRAFITYKGKTYFGEVKRCTTKKEDVVVKTYDATDITSTTAHISGEVMNKDINFEGEQFGFYYDTQASLDTNSPYSYGIFTSSSSGSFYMNMSKLTPETTYYYRAFVTYKGKTYSGEVKHFTTKKRINDVVPDSILEVVGKYIPIYPGNNPPSLEGDYLMSPMTLFFDSGNYYKSGKIFYDQYLMFYNQDAMNRTIDYDGFQLNNSGNISSEEYGIGAYISGENDRFSIYFNTDGENYYDDGTVYTKTALIISGTKTDAGIKDVYYAFIIVDKKNDPNHHVMEIGEFRVFVDGDGLAERVELYDSRTRANKSEPSPMLPSRVDNGSGVSFQKGISFDVWKKKRDERMKTK